MHAATTGSAGTWARREPRRGTRRAGFRSGLKYEEQGGPALRDLADLLRNFGDPREVTSLLRRTTFNMAVGNADALAWQHLDPVRNVEASAAIMCGDPEPMREMLGALVRDGT